MGSTATTSRRSGLLGLSCEGGEALAGAMANDPPPWSSLPRFAAAWEGPHPPTHLGDLPEDGTATGEAGKDTGGEGEAWPGSEPRRGDRTEGAGPAS